MKKLLALLSISVYVVISVAQIQPHEANLFLKFIDPTEKPVPFIKAIIKNMDGSKPQYSVTDSRGNAQFKVTTGNSYQVYIFDTLFVSSINIPVNGMSYVTQKLTIPDLPVEQMVEKTTIDTIDQSKLSLERPDPGNVFLKIGLSNHLNQAVKNKEVRILSTKLKTVYTAKTNSYGYAQFHVPGNNSYIVGVDKFEQFDTVSVSRHSFALMLTYIPTKVSEYEKNDTIIQSPDANMRTTTDRALIKIHLKDHDNKPLAKEEVYFNVLESSKVYMGKTGNDGVLTMLLPKGFSYELNFKYERAMKRLDYPLTPTLYTTQFYMTYIGSKKVEEFYANANRENGYRTDFMDSKANKLIMEPGIFEKTSRGFNLNFPDEGTLLTPAVYENKLFVSAGYYSPNIYCIDAITGEPIWGLKLAESGPSVLVVDDGMLLINTQSCTLYAIDLETGILAWSKWLGPNIYHSPTVANGKVYAAYPDDLSQTSNRFVLAAFNLKTGDLVWQNRLKNEPLSAPVVANNYVFITDQKGSLYSFNEDKGESLAVFQANATCPPVYHGDMLWVNIISDNKHPISCLSSFNPKSLTMIKKLESVSDSADSGVKNAAELMSYSRNRLLINKGIYYQINSKGLQALSPDGTVKWTLPLKTNLDYDPILTFAGKYFLATTHSNKFALIDPGKGLKIKDYYIPDVVASEPVVANGWIYCGTKNGKLVAINTKDKEITGWNQWGLNASHNPVIE